MPKSEDKIEIENFTSPGRVKCVDRAKYIAMRDALLSVLPARSPGVTVPDAKKALLPSLPDTLFPGGNKSGWWLKAVQLDLEAKGVIKRATTSPIRLFRSTGKD